MTALAEAEILYQNLIRFFHKVRYQLLELCYVEPVHAGEGER